MANRWRALLRVESSAVSPYVEYPDPADYVINSQAICPESYGFNNTATHPIIKPVQLIVQFEADAYPPESVVTLQHDIRVTVTITVNGPGGSVVNSHIYTWPAGTQIYEDIDGDFTITRGYNGDEEQYVTYQPGGISNISAIVDLEMDIRSWGSLLVTKTQQRLSGNIPHENVTFTATRLSDNQTFSATTNAAGEALFNQLPHGIYGLTEVIPPFNTSSINNSSPPQINVIVLQQATFHVTNILDNFNIQTRVSPSGAGTATVNGSTNIQVDAGTSLTFVASPGLDYLFDGWYKDGSLVVAPSQATSDGIYEARFTLKEYTVSVLPSPPEGGIATINGVSSVTGPAGTPLIPVAVSNSHFIFSGWQHNGHPATAPLQIVTDAIYYALFDAIEYTINVSVNPVGAGSATVNGVSGFMGNFGDALVFVQTPGAEYEFVGWTENGNPVSPPATIDGNRNLVAVYQFRNISATRTSERKLLIRWRNDGESEWKKWREVDLGQKGDYAIIKHLHGLGCYRTRQYQIVSTCSMPISIIALEEDVKVQGQ